MIIDILWERMSQLYDFLILSSWGLKQLSATMFFVNAILTVVAGNFVKNNLINNNGGETLDSIVFVIFNKNDKYVHKKGEKWVKLFKFNHVMFFVILLMMIMAWL